MLRTKESSSFNNGLYHRHLRNLKFDQKIFDDITDYAVTTKDWQAGYDKRGFRFNLEYIRLDIEKFPVLQEIYDCWDVPFKKPHFILSKVLPGGLIMHHDFAKTGNLGFPLYGDFTNTPQWYFDYQSNVTEEFYYEGSPVVFNTQILHAVPMPETETKPRIILMMNQYTWMPDIFKKYDDGLLWQSSDNFYYEENNDNEPTE